MATRTNHTLVQSYDQLEVPPEHQVVGTVAKYKRWEQKIFHIANTADCAREVRMVVSITEHAPGDPDRENIVITFRKYSPRGWAEPRITLEDLYEGDRVDIAYDLDKDGEPANIIVLLNRDTDEINRERRDRKNWADYKKSIEEYEQWKQEREAVD